MDLNSLTDFSEKILEMVAVDVDRPRTVPKHLVEVQVLVPERDRHIHKKHGNVQFVHFIRYLNCF